MNIPFLRRQHKLRSRFTVETENEQTVFWKLLISPNGILAGEERNLEAKTSSVFAYDLRRSKFLWRGKKIGEDWWFASERVTNDTLYIQTFRKPDLPEPKGIIAVDLSTGRIRWEQPELSFLAEQGEQVFAMRQGFEHHDYFIIDKMSGEILEAEPDSVSPTVHHEDAENANQCYPMPIGEDHPSFEKISGLVKDTLQAENIRGSIDFLEFRKYLIFSYHERRTEAEYALRNLLKNNLRVIDSEKNEVVFEDTLNHFTNYPVPDNFFVAENTLIFVKEKRYLIGIALP